MSERREPLSNSGYERPQQTWQCGLADDGPPCPVGPTARGQCPAAAACRPVRDGDRWQCNRSPLRGGPCEAGPGPDGQCAIVYRCTPMRSLRSRRGRFVAAIAAAALGAACMALSGDWRNDLAAPGPLSVHHAKMLAGERQSSRCAQCHAAGNASVGQWWAHSSGGEPLAPAQAVLCMKCHEGTIAGDAALVAHNAPRLLAHSENSTAPVPAFHDRSRDPSAPIACAACHREHQGTRHDLTRMSDQACQACHREQFASFADGHPEFAAWPYETPTRIAFDHASHQGKHFPAEQQTFDCAACHVASDDGQRQLTREYAVTCARCHDQSLAASLVDGMPLVALPMLDTEAIAEAGRDIGPWPEQASGDFDGALPAATRLLLAGDPRGAAALSTLGPRFDFLDVDPDDEAQVRVAADAAAALVALVNDLADRGQTAVGERLESALGRKLSAVELQSLVGGLSPDATAGFRDRWLKESGGPSGADNDTDRTALRARVTAGGWVRDDRTLSLRYHASGHADPWLRAWLDVLAEAASSSRPEMVELASPLLQAALKPTAPGQCGSCHTLRRDAAGRFAIQWQPLGVADEPATLTRFAHGPHVLDPQHGDCASCHRIAAGSLAGSSTATSTPRAIRDFAAMDRASCAECHTARAAGDSCTQCHRYHQRIEHPLPVFSVLQPPASP